jgi:hypothetical protein
MLDLRWFAMIFVGLMTAVIASGMLIVLRNQEARTRAVQAKMEQMATVMADARDEFRGIARIMMQRDGITEAEIQQAIHEDR